VAGEAVAAAAQQAIVQQVFWLIRSSFLLLFVVNKVLLPVALWALDGLLLPAALYSLLVAVISQLPSCASRDALSSALPADFVLNVSSRAVRDATSRAAMDALLSELQAYVSGSGGSGAAAGGLLETSTYEYAKRLLSLLPPILPPSTLQNISSACMSAAEGDGCAAAMLALLRDAATAAVEYCRSMWSAACTAAAALQSRSDLLLLFYAYFAWALLAAAVACHMLGVSHRAGLTCSSWWSRIRGATDANGGKGKGKEQKQKGD
jgi:hypothetical protein